MDYNILCFSDSNNHNIQLNKFDSCLSHQLLVLKYQGIPVSTSWCYHQSLAIYFNNCMGKPSYLEEEKCYPLWFILIHHLSSKHDRCLQQFISLKWDLLLSYSVLFHGHFKSGIATVKFHFAFLSYIAPALRVRIYFCYMQKIQ